MIIKVKPKDWRELQVKVGEILSESNFKVEIEKKIKSVRSEIEIDVFAEEIIDDRTYTILCECKMWKSNIPQLYVHGLRTVVHDIGANKGYIISSSKFQKGSVDSTGYTNIELLTWNEFQKKFFKSWYINFFSKRLNSIIKSDYDSLAIQLFDDYTKIDKCKFSQLIKKYNGLKEVKEHFPFFYSNIITEEFKDIEEKLPLRNKIKLEEWEDIESLGLTDEILDEVHYSDFLILISDFAKPVYQELDKLDLFIEYN